MLLKKKWCGCEIHETLADGVRIDNFILPCCKHTTMICLKEDCYFCRGKRVKREAENMGNHGSRVSDDNRLNEVKV